MILDIRHLKNCILKYSKTWSSRSSTYNFLFDKHLKTMGKKIIKKPRRDQHEFCPKDRQNFLIGQKFKLLWISCPFSHIFTPYNPSKQEKSHVLSYYTKTPKTLPNCSLSALLTSRKLLELIFYLFRKTMFKPIYHKDREAWIRHRWRWSTVPNLDSEYRVST